MKTTYQFNIDRLKTVTPSMAYDGSDFVAWQASARAKLAELMGLDKFEKVDPDLEIKYEQKIDGATEICFTFASEEGWRVPGHLLLPDGVENPPLMICLQGHSKGMHLSLNRPKYETDEESIRECDRDFCIRAVKEGFAAIAIEQRNFGVCAGMPDGRTNCFESTMNALIMGRTTAAERVWDVCRLIDLVESVWADKVDVKRICLMGESGGGTATAYTAALEDRIVLAIPAVAMCTYRDSIGAMKHCSCNYIPRIATYLDMGDIMAMAYPKYFVQINGKDDPIFPLHGAKEVFANGQKAYAAAGDASRCVHLIGNGAHRFYAEEAWAAVHKYLG